MAKKEVRKVQQIDVDNPSNVIAVWPSAYQASEALRVSCQQIKRICNGERKTPLGGFMWKWEG